MTDAQLLLEFREQKSHPAFSLLVDRHVGWIYAVARRRVRDEHLAHDVTQAVFLLLAERAHKIRTPDRLSAWLLQTTVFAANHAIREESRRRRRERTVASSHREAETPADQAETFAQLELVESVIGKLDEADRTLIAIRFYQGRSFTELGAELGISQDAARKRLDRALQRLRFRLQTGPVAEKSLAPLLSGLTAITRHSSAGSLPAITTSNGSSPRAISISTGVSQMLFLTKIRNVAALIVVLLTLGGGGVLMYVHAEPGESAPSAATAHNDGPARDRWLECPSLIVVIAPDGNKITGYSKKTGQWADVQGRQFKLDRVIATGDVAAYRDGSDLLAYSAVTNTWSRVELPAGTDSSVMDVPVVGYSEAAFAVPGMVYAYSTVTGTWATLKVPENEPVIPLIGVDVVTATAGGKMYFFGVKTGKWSDGF